MNALRLTLAAAMFVAAHWAWAQAAAPSDPQIAHIVVTANNVDIAAGKLAQSRGQNKEVKRFGKEMVKDHTALNKQSMALVKKLKVTPEDNPTSQSLKSGGDETMNKLKGLKGKDFDKAYIDSEVTYHQNVIDAIDKTLIPNAKNDQLKALLEKAKPVIQGHLEHAKQIQATLNK